MIRRILQWCLRLYPAAWRRRYEAEFTALLEDLPAPGWRDAWDTVKGAMTMRMGLPAGPLTLALAGAALAFAGSFAIKDQFITQGTLRLRPTAGHSVGEMPILESMAIAQQLTFTRRNLTGMIERHGLYARERASMPMEDVIEKMQRSIRVTGVEKGFVRVAFQYPEPHAAQRVARELTTDLIDTYSSGNSSKLAALEVHDLPALPEGPAYPNRKVIAVLGLAAGGIAGGVILLWRRRAKNLVSE